MENFFDILAVIAILIATFAGLGAGGWFSTEIVKTLANIIGARLPSTFQIKGRASWVVAALVALGYVFGLDIEMLGDFTAFEGLDADMLQIINAALLAMGANLWHDKVFDA